MNDTSIIDDADVFLGASIKVIGVGDGGCRAVQHMIESGLLGVEFVCANTDTRVLNTSTAEQIHLVEKLSSRRAREFILNPKFGREAAIENIDALRNSIGETEMLFVIACMGGSTGSGAASVVAQVAREMNVLTVGLVTKPFGFEGPKPKKASEEGLTELRQNVDCLITIPNDRVFDLYPNKCSFIDDWLEHSNEALYHAVKCISDVLNAEGMIGIDFSDVRTIMQESGMALMGTGVGSGENRARDASQKAISCPLLEGVSLDRAKAIIYNITASRKITVPEINEIGSVIREAASEDCDMILFGVVFDDTIGDDLRVTLIASGINVKAAFKRLRRRRRKEKRRSSLSSCEPDTSQNNVSHSHSSNYIRKRANVAEKVIFNYEDDEFQMPGDNIHFLRGRFKR